MIGNAMNDSIYDVVVLKVEDRWYICGDATYSNAGYAFMYEYKTPTLKFILDIEVGYAQLDLCGFLIELMGYLHSLKLEYV